MSEAILLYSWEIGILSEHIEKITHDLASLLEKAGYKKNGDWTDGFFTITPILDRERNHSTLTLNLKSNEFTRKAPIRDLIDHVIRRDEEYIIYSKFQKGPGYYGAED